MKIDYDKIKIFLNIFIEEEKPYINTKDIFLRLGYDVKNDKEANEVWHYLKLLNDENLIECLGGNLDLGFTLNGNGSISIGIKNFRITSKGYQTFEIITTSKVWEKLKKSAKELGIESIKQIPSLAIKIITENL